MRLRTNSIVDKGNGGNVNFNDPPDFNNNLVIVTGNLNVIGISTVGFLTVLSADVSGIITATSFIGDGSQLTGVQSVSPSKSIALKLIIADPPLRS